MNASRTSPERPRLLLTGATGFLGWHVIEAARADYDIHAIEFQNQLPPELPGVRPHRIDLTHYASLKTVFEESRPALVIHLAAQSNANFVQRHRDEAQRINVDAAAVIAGLAAARGARLVFASTDLVFDGIRAPYREDDAVNPVSFYGEQKVFAEEGTLAEHPTACIARPPLLFGMNPADSPGRSFLAALLQGLRLGQRQRLFADEHRTPAAGRDVARGLIDVAAKQAGRLHLGGPQRVSRYEFGERVCEAFDLDPRLLEESSQKGADLAAPRPPDVSLNSARAFGLGYAPEEILDALKRDALVV